MQIDRQKYEKTYLKFVSLVPEKDEKVAAISDRLLKRAFLFMNNLEIRGKFVINKHRKDFKRKYHCSFKRTELKNLTAPKSCDCNFQVSLTVVGEVDKNPNEMPPDFKDKALYLVVLEMTDDHNWSTKVSDHPAPGNNFEFGPHGTMCISQFGNHDQTEIGDYLKGNKPEFIPLEVPERPTMVTAGK